MAEQQDIQEQVVIGRVAGKNVQAPQQGFTEPTTWVRLAYGAITMRAPGDVVDKLPADGEWAAFQVRPAKKGSTPQVLSWGWITSITDLYSGSPQLDIQWVGSFGRAGVSMGGGVQPPKKK